MITRFLTSVNVAFNPFTRRGRTARLFLALLPKDARSYMKVNTTIWDRNDKEGGMIEATFKDGKEVKLDTSNMTLKDIVEEMDRHSRVLGRKEDLAG